MIKVTRLILLKKLYTQLTQKLSNLFEHIITV